MLKITIHDTPQAFRLQLEGKLAGPWVAELESCWQTGSSTVLERDLVVDLKGVTFVDAAGRCLLVRMHQAGAQFTTCGLMMRALVDEIRQAATAAH
ncbi:MAG TPA: hypothetical protein VFA33_22170 [Bryobacteraceae bacterium]|nr:hypothetical protein [Bryobacteraceae bacterium]